MKLCDTNCRNNIEQFLQFWPVIVIIIIITFFTDTVVVMQVMKTDDITNALLS